MSRDGSEVAASGQFANLVLRGQPYAYGVQTKPNEAGVAIKELGEAGRFRMRTGVEPPGEAATDGSARAAELQTALGRSGACAASPILTPTRLHALPRGSDAGCCVR